MRRTVLVSLVAALVFTTGVYAGGRAQEAQAGPVTLTANITGVGKIDHGWVWHILLNKLGIEIEPVTQGAEALQTAIAARNLPDLTVIVNNSTDRFFVAVEAGLLHDLDKYKDQLPHVHTKLAAGLEYNRDMVKQRNLPSGAYAIPQNLNNRSSPITDKYDVGPFLRWDYYYQMGHPEMKTIDDYIPLLKEMVKRFPVDENGNPNIGFSIFGDDDKNTGWVGEASRYAKMHGQIQIQFLEVDVATGRIRSIFDDDSYYKKGLQFLFNANQEGLLDPNSVTQTFDQWREKTATGRILAHFYGYSWTNFWTDEKERQGIYYGFVPFLNERIPNTAGAPTYTPNAPGGLGLSSRLSGVKLEKALALLEYMNSYDGRAALVYGLPGIESGVWDVIDNKPVPLGTFDPNTGGVLFLTGGAPYPLYNTGFSTANINELLACSIHLRMIHPAWGESLLYLEWSSWDNRMDPTNLFEAQRMEVYGKYGITVNGVMDLARRMGIELPVRPYALDPIPENIVIINNRVGSAAVTAHWRMIFARNQAEFDRIWNECKTQANGMGLAQSLDWYRAAYERGVNSVQKYVDIWNNTPQIP
jgi:putative aldouronate transport system substrate-binding protein